MTPDFVTSKLQDGDLNPGLTDLESGVCPTWSQLPLRVQKPRYLPKLTLHVFAILPSFLSGALRTLTSRPPAADRLGSAALMDHMILTPLSLCSSCSGCSGQPGSHLCLTRSLTPSPQTFRHNVARSLPNTTLKFCLTIEILFGLVLFPKNLLS